MKMRFVVSTLVLAIALVHYAHAHISLTFPPARFPSYDFLDNVRTGGPCGVPDDPNGEVTTFRSGSTFNVTFHLAYAHRGGILVNIVNRNGSISHPLLGTEWINVNDSTRVHQEVTLPSGFTCDRCVLQLLRQAGEWSAPGGGYVFWSCADIAVVDSPDAECNAQKCSGHGVCNKGVCTCDRLYSGKFCQNKDECVDESDCSYRGSCVDVMATKSPRKQCFCNPGWFRESCSQASPIIDASIDPIEYTIRRQLNERLVLYARIVGDEIEVALKHNGTGYVAFGWRPSRGIDGSCRAEAPGNFPLGTHPLWPDEQTIPLVNFSTNTIQVINLPLFNLGGGATEEGGGATEEGGADEEGRPQGGATEEGGADEEGRPQGGGSEEGGADEEGRPQGGGSEEGGADEEGRPQDGGSEEGGADEEGRPQDGGSEEGGADEEGRPIGGGGSEEGGADEGPAEEGGGGAPLHPMDCMDIVIGVARGNQYRVFDYYTRDRSTPRRDAFYGGQDSIMGAIAKEENGVTFVIWRKPLVAADPADHTISNELMSVIWSFGQVFPDYFHNPGSGIEAGTAGNDRFYQPDDIKYHGTRNRGATSINFFDVDSNIDERCQGEFSTGCDAQGMSCDYRATWEVKGSSIEFTVTARQEQAGQTEWVAVGFSDDVMMPNSDLVVGAADDTGFFVTDRFIETYAPAPIDDSQDISNATASSSNGFTTMQFTRPLAASNPRDLSLTECRFFFFGWGGSANVASRSIEQHLNTPIVSTDRICLPEPRECGASAVSGASRIATPITVLLLSLVLLTTAAAAPFLA